ncbi:F-box protein GID2-like [Castanea sativa]|uniref:F-box protein GID2-like n=1 Tax=Castanea sativa TaxID=21020 RepID=UPI003F64C8A2
MKKRGLAENHEQEEEQQEDKKMKRIRVEEEEEEEENEEENESGFMNLDENLLYEVLKHVDARTLGSAACVSKLWHKTVQDERLWELICTKHWANIGCPNQQLRSVVLALGGFRRLHSLFLWPLLKPQSSSSSSSAAAASASSSLSSSSTASSSSSSAWSPFAPMVSSKPPPRWGKDEMQLSLSLLSIRYYEKMNFNSRGR